MINQLKQYSKTWKRFCNFFNEKFKTVDHPFEDFLKEKYPKSNILFDDKLRQAVKNIDEFITIPFDKLDFLMQEGVINAFLMGEGIYCEITTAMYVTGFVGFEFEIYIKEKTCMNQLDKGTHFETYQTARIESFVKSFEILEGGAN